MNPPDDSWSMIEEAVFRLFADATAENGSRHVRLGEHLAELGWSEIEAEYPTEAGQLLFRARARTLANTDCLDRVMLAELGAAVDGSATAVILPLISQKGRSDAAAPDCRDIPFSGVVVGNPHGRLAVAVAQPHGVVGVGTVSAQQLRYEPADTFDRASTWTRVSGVLNCAPPDASAQWTRALAAGRRALGTELAALSDAMLELAITHTSTRTQFGSPIGSFQAPRHALAGAYSELEGARALLAESWQCGGEFSALVAKAAAGRTHRVVADVAMQLCGAIGLTIEHDLHRYVARGVQIDALLGSHLQLEAEIAARLLDTDHPDSSLPDVVSCG
ncbi:Uncharacterised protein [Mycolicibacterium vanbaalenii]|uniref:Acyl-CoA dehydrogenase/oxidase C-terminal domain-containing protein n=1 Tax=Mycolicibacterium vanbaalenii TaxID=110539 RepID=A0A5S9NFX6_MYCVN|nr:acyl-CoA dehydrogenase family protein [Mycolicibacterium vanbaalenii]CAA0089342.1 Uncharacterised protein [Mycolicibacterium vanbaalenii]